MNVKFSPTVLTLWRWLPLPVVARTMIKKTVYRLSRSVRKLTTEHTVSPSIRVTRKTPIGRRDFLVFGIIDWDFRVQRPQHLAREIARMGNTVFFIEPHFNDESHPGYSIRRIADQDEVMIVRLLLSGSPQIYFKGPSAEQLKQLEGGMTMLMQDWGIEASAVIAEHAYWTPIVTALPNSIGIYDCMDHHEGFGGVPDELVALEHCILERSDLVVVTSAWLEDWGMKRSIRTEVIRNGCDFEYFALAPTNIYQPTKGRKVIGYYGAIADWFDVELVKAVSLAHADCEVVLVGADTVGAKKALASFNNVSLLGEQPYTHLTHFLYGFDVCLLPFQNIPLTQATNPVKVYEYLCSGKHVVCVDLPEISQFGELVFKGKSHQEFVKLVGKCLDQPPTNEQIALRQAFASSQTWNHRAQQFMDSLSNIRWPSMSVVVLTYNNWSYTEACLKSVLNTSDYPGRLEVVVSDNGSTDETIERLKEWQVRDSRLKLVLNGTNLGFAAGNNAGLGVASGDFLVMLNNDTVVTRGWLLTMWRHFQQTPLLGLLGPVTNNIGNEAKVSVHYDKPDDMPAAAREYTLPRMKQVFPIRTLAFFCVMLPRNVLNTVGLLDEQFGAGFFEDDDYCRRVEHHGYTLACAEDVFVHHHLSASFDQVPNFARRSLFEKNKAYYESKWGSWDPHQYR
jgi:GT2 family glycosyltransferase/glycosyltransferase involved in cell wall biosynthesis